MNVTRDQILRMIYECIDELNEQLLPEQPLSKVPHTALFGPSAGLDSLGFVNFMALVEDQCERNFGIALSLTEGSATGEATDPFNTVGELADLIRRLLIENKRIEA